MTTPRNGFSLVETAIVIGLVGIIVGGTAIAMTAVRNAQLAEQSLQQIYSFVDNFRNYYAARALPSCSIAETTAATYTTTLRQRSVFPESMCSASCVAAGSATVRNPYGGAVTVEAVLSGSNCDRILLNLTEMGKKGCARLLMDLSDRYTQTGLLRTRVNSGSTRLSTVDFPLSVQTANNDCSSDTSNTMDLYFSIRR